MSDWDFRTADTKEYTHCFHNYPAMMIPQIARRLIDCYGQQAKLLFDPYCGTGTSLVEANLRGINAIGTDLNPLARLIATTKTTPLPLKTLDLYLKDFNDFVFRLMFSTELPTVTLPVFKNIDYWFDQPIKHKLAVIKHYIGQLDEPTIQNFFRIAFSETVRESLWTRNSEFKLYRMTEKQRAKFAPDPFGLMLTKLARNKRGLHQFLNKRTGEPTSQINRFNTVNDIPALLTEAVDLVVTSPLYGDSRTTVAYGQFSRLSSQWLGFEEASQVDKLLMGGQSKPRAHQAVRELLADELTQIQAHDAKRANEVVAFFADYAISIGNVARAVKPKGMVCYVVGNRTVKGVNLPTDRVTQQLFESYGFRHLNTFQRNIPNKRMPSRNSPSNVVGAMGKTMAKEFIVVLQKS